MNKEELFSFVPDQLDEEIYRKIKKKWDGKSKPLDGFGDFEELVCRIGAISGSDNMDISKRAAVIFCADNGVVAEGISQCGSEVTKSVARALGEGVSTVNILCQFAGCDVFAVDVGIDSQEELFGVIDKKVRRGTGNILTGPALSEDEVMRAVNAGIEMACELHERGYRLIISGEMGIGNTTTSAAVLSALLRMDSDMICGRGAGLDDAGLERKRSVIKAALAQYDFELLSKKERAFEILRCLGGLDIAALSGLFIGGSIYHVPVVIDGMISATAALLAEYMAEGVRNYMLPSHHGREKGTDIALSELSLSPYISGNMALGEGTGAVMLLPLADMMLNYYKNGISFETAGIDNYKRFDNDSCDGN